MAFLPVYRLFHLPAPYRSPQTSLRFVVLGGFSQNHPLQHLYPEDTAGLVQTICKLAVPVAICTIREYEQMKREQ